METEKSHSILFARWRTMRYSGLVVWESEGLRPRGADSVTLVPRWKPWKLGRRWGYGEVEMGCAHTRVGSPENQELQCPMVENMDVLAQENRNNSFFLYFLVLFKPQEIGQCNVCQLSGNPLDQSRWYKINYQKQQINVNFLFFISTCLLSWRNSICNPVFYVQRLPETKFSGSISVEWRLFFFFFF